MTEYRKISGSDFIQFFLVPGMVFIFVSLGGNQLNLNIFFSFLSGEVLGFIIKKPSKKLLFITVFLFLLLLIADSFYAFFSLNFKMYGITLVGILFGRYLGRKQDRKGTGR